MSLTMSNQFMRFSLWWTILCISSLVLLPTAILAHGGEDHGDAKPQSQTTAKGTVSHTARPGEIEVMLKHPELIPDTATSGKLFFTKIETNDPVDKVVAVIEIEATGGTMTQAVVEKTDETGIFRCQSAFILQFRRY